MAPSSVSTASTVSQGPITLPLFKFSHCTSPSSQAKVIWTHLPQRSDMFAVFDVIRQVGIGMAVVETKVLKLVRGGELLEQVELPNLQKQVRMDEEGALSQPISDNHLRVLIIVKRPLLALRYMLPDGQIRKTQMNFVPFSGCDVALENFRAAGLPIRDKDLPQAQGQRPYSSQSQPHSQERPGSMNAGQAARPHSSQSLPHSQEWLISLNAGQAARPPSSQGAFPGTSESFSQEHTRVWNAGPGSIPPSAQSTRANIGPNSAPGEVKQDDFSRPVSAPFRSLLGTAGPTLNLSTVLAVANPTTQLGLLPSPMFSGMYEPFGSFQSRPASPPDQTQTQRDHTDTLQLSQMLPPERTLPFPEKKIHPFRKDEIVSQERSSQETPASFKAKAKRQTKPRAQSAKTRKSKAKAETRVISTYPPAQSSIPPSQRTKGNAPSPHASSMDPVPELQAIPPSSEPPALPSISPRKRPSPDGPIDQRNKRQAQIRTEAVTETMPEAPMTAIPEQPLQTPPKATDPLITISGHDLLDAIDNLMRKYHDHPVPRPPLQTAKEDLAEYAAQSAEDRTKAIDNLICECIQDENFERLMEDVEGAWKRIGLGL